MATIPTLKVNLLPTFPAAVVASTGIAVAKASGIYTFSLSFASLNQVTTIASADQAKALFAVYNGNTQAFASIAFSDLIAAVNAISLTPALSALAALTPAANKIPYYTGATTAALMSTVNGAVVNTNASGVPALTVTPVLGVAGASTGTLGLSGVTSGVVTIQPQAAAGTYNFNLPTTAGTAGQPLLSGGGGAAAMTFGTLGVAAGGTGQTTLTSHGVLLGNGAGAVAATAEGATKSLLQGTTGSNPAFTTTPTVAGFTVNANVATLPVPPAGAILQVGNADSNSTSVLIDTFGLGGLASAYLVRKARGIASSLSALQTDDAIGGMSAIGYGATGYSASQRGTFSILAAENWTDAAQGTYAVIYTTATGGIVSAEKLRVGPDGTVTLAKALTAANGGTGATSVAGARASAGLNVESFTGRGDAIYTILATDRFVGTNTAFTASRTFTLPAANAVNPGQSLIVVDAQGTVTGTNTLVIQRAGGDTINGGASITISVAYGAYILYSDGVSKWTAQGYGAVSGVTSIFGRSGVVSAASGDYTLSQVTVGLTTKGDTIYTILSTDRVVSLTGTLTAPRTWTLPAASSVAAGLTIQIVDTAGGITANNPLVVSRGGADTIDGTSSITLNSAFSNLEVMSDGTSKWKIVKCRRPRDIQKFTSGSGTYTTPLGAAYLKVRIVGGGGGGAGSGTTPGAATAGGSTTFGGLTGGGGALGPTGGGGAGGAGSGGDVNITGGTGGLANQLNACPGGVGGGTPLGPGGFGGVIFTAYAGGAPVANTGAGGGGAGQNATVNSGGGGGGGGYVEAILGSPSATYAYAVGAGGAAGTAGTSGAVGGAGATGLIIVEAHFQ